MHGFARSRCEAEYERETLVNKRSALFEKNTGYRRMHRILGI
jgi:hypothetical protein